MGVIAFRKAEARDIRGIIPLFRAVAPQYSRSEAYYRWLHFENPRGKSVTLIGETEGGIVAHVAISAVRLPDGTIAGFPQQVLVHPNHRSIQTTMALLKQLNEHLSGSFGVGIGFPNAVFAPVLEKIGRWDRRTQIIDLVVRPNRSEAISDTTFFRSLVSSSFLAEEANEIDAQWLQWRYLNHPTEHYDIIGASVSERVTAYVVLKVHAKNDHVRVGHIVEAGWPNDTRMLALRDATLSWCQYHDVSFLTSWDSAGYDDLLLATGALIDTDEYEPVQTNVFTYNMTSLERQGLMMGVSDVY